MRKQRIRRGLSERVAKARVGDHFVPLLGEGQVWDKTQTREPSIQAVTKAVASMDRDGRVDGFLADASGYEANESFGVLHSLYKCPAREEYSE